MMEPDILHWIMIAAIVAMSFAGVSWGALSRSRRIETDEMFSELNILHGEAIKKKNDEIKRLKVLNEKWAEEAGKNVEIINEFQSAKINAFTGAEGKFYGNLRWPGQDKVALRTAGRLNTMQDVRDCFGPLWQDDTKFTSNGEPNE